MLAILLVSLLVLGLIVGSFLNALIYRLESKQKNIRTEKHKNRRNDLFGRSFCPNCGNQIAWHDNIPVVSWLVLRGKCRSCKKEISVQYPLVELVTGLVFMTIGWLFLISEKGSLDFAIAPLGMTGGWLFFGACLIVIFAYDLKHQIIPDEIIYTLLIAGLLYVLINTVFLGDYRYLIDHLLSGLIAGGFFYSLAAVSKGKWMGGGDIKLVAFMGLVLGWQDTLVALYVAFILGAIVGGVALLSKQKKLGSKIPFGPFLIIGTMTGLFYGSQIVSFYVNMFL